MEYSFTEQKMADIISATIRSTDGSHLPQDLLQRFWFYCKDYNFPYPFDARLLHHKETA